jgi:hypothetical protein
MMMSEWRLVFEKQPTLQTAIPEGAADFDSESFVHGTFVNRHHGELS